MRGKADGFHEKFGDLGITPAYAGKRPGRRGSAALRQDHPRLCGEKQQIIKAFRQGNGITPAYAGKSSSETV